MKIFLKVKTGAREESIEQLMPNTYLAKVKEPPVEGRANRALIRLLASHFKVAQNSVRLVAGLKSKQKIAVISDLGR